MKAKDEPFRLSINHYGTLVYSERVTRKQLQQVFLRGDDSIIFHGNLVKMKVKHLGVGIYEIYKDLPENKCFE